MRGFAVFTALAALAVTSLADGWKIKNPYEAKAKYTYNVTISANVGGQTHEAKLKQVLTITSLSEKGAQGKEAWVDVLVDGTSPGTDPDPWDVAFNPDGSILSSGESADYARMLTPMAFVYPTQELKVGEKWSSKYKPAKDAKLVTIDYEVVAEEKVGDADTLKVKAKLTEDGPMKGDNVYWVGKDGKVLKFELDLKNWVVPFVNGEEVDAKLKGELAKG